MPVGLTASAKECENVRSIVGHSLRLGALSIHTITFSLPVIFAAPPPAPAAASTLSWQ
jgi:hypothetical protein